MHTKPSFDEGKSISLPHICQRDNAISPEEVGFGGMIYSARIECQDSKFVLSVRLFVAGVVPPELFNVPLSSQKSFLC